MGPGPSWGTMVYSPHPRRAAPQCSCAWARSLHLQERLLQLGFSSKIIFWTPRPLKHLLSLCARRLLISKPSQGIRASASAALFDVYAGKSSAYFRHIEAFKNGCLGARKTVGAVKADI